MSREKYGLIATKSVDSQTPEAQTTHSQGVQGGDPDPFLIAALTCRVNLLASANF